MKRRIILFLVLLLPSVLTSGPQVLFREDFQDLTRWKNVSFPKNKRHSTYTAVRDGQQTYLKAESRDSASLLIYRETFDPYAYPQVSWRWKVDALLPKEDLSTKAGDDVPIRIYIAFAYDPKHAGALERAQYNAARLIYGEYPPLRSLNYIWSSRAYPTKIFDSAYTGRNKMIILEQGPAKVGTWVAQEVDILADYRKVFGADPPAAATIGIMSDSDNTHGAATAYVADLTVFRGR